MGCYASKPHNGFPIHHLPTEILVKILFQLDGYSLNNVFDAFPTIAKRFVLIKDRPHTVVFICTSLRRVELHDFKKGSFRAYLKVFELRTQGSHWFREGLIFDLIARCYELRCNEFCSNLDSYCFVHLRDVCPGRSCWVPEIMGELFLTGATFECSNCPPGTILSNPSRRQIRKFYEFGTSLIIKNVSVVKSFELSKYLESLTIIFKASSKIPKIGALKFPKSFRSLTIVFYGGFPSIVSMTYNYELNPGSFQPVIFELTNAASMKTAIGAMPSIHQLYGERFTISLSKEFEQRITGPLIYVLRRQTLSC